MDEAAPPRGRGGRRGRGDWPAGVVLERLDDHGLRRGWRDYDHIVRPEDAQSRHVGQGSDVGRYLGCPGHGELAHGGRG